MTYLKKVFRQINSFCKLAQQSWTMPDDPNEEEDLSQKLIEIGNSLSNPDMRTDLGLIIQKYREVLNIKGGYNNVIKSIDKFINTQLYSIDEDDAEYDVANDLEEALLDLNADLEARAKEAGGGINKGDTAEAHAAINRIQEQFDEEVRENELSGGPSTSDLTQFDPNAISTLDLTGGVDKETAQEKGRGYSVGVVRTPKDWIDFYTKEKEKYEEDIKTEKNRRTLEKKQGIITVINQLIPQLEIESRLYEIASTTDDKEINAKLAKVRETIKGLRSQRGHLRAGLRNSTLEENITRVQEELSKARTPKEKLILEQELELQKLLRSPDANKGAETKARKMLLAYLPSMTQSPAGMATLQKLIDNVNAAAAKKISKKIIDKEEWQKIKTKREIGDFEGLTSTLNQHVPNTRMGDKIKLIAKEAERLITIASEEEKTKYKPILDAIANAKRTNNKAMLKEAMSMLYAALKSIEHQFKEWKEALNAFDQQYKEVVEFGNACRVIVKNGIHKKSELTQADKAFVIRTLELGTSIDKSKLRESTKPTLTSLINELSNILWNNGIPVKNETHKEEPVRNLKIELVDKITGEIEQEVIDEKDLPKYQDMADKELTIIGAMMKTRRKILDEIIKKAFMDENAAEIGAILSDEKLNSIKDANQYAHEVFQQMLEMLEDKLV
jgi:hypothetical protein